MPYGGLTTELLVGGLTTAREPSFLVGLMTAFPPTPATTNATAIATTPSPTETYTGTSPSKCRKKLNLYI